MVPFNATKPGTFKLKQTNYQAATFLHALEMKTFGKSLWLWSWILKKSSILHLIPELLDGEELSSCSSKPRLFHIVRNLLAQPLGFPAFSHVAKQIENLLVMFHQKRNTCWYVKTHCSCTSAKIRGLGTNPISVGPVICIILSTGWGLAEHYVSIVHALRTCLCLTVDRRWFFLASLSCKCLKLWSWFEEHLGARSCLNIRWNRFTVEAVSPNIINIVRSPWRCIFQVVHSLF